MLFVHDWEGVMTLYWGEILGNRSEKVGKHCTNDSGLAVAMTLAAVWTGRTDEERRSVASNLKETGHADLLTIHTLALHCICQSPQPLCTHGQSYGPNCGLGS